MRKSGPFRSKNEIATLIIILISSIRGVFVLYFGLPATYIYTLSFFSVISFSTICFFQLKSSVNIPPIQIKLIYYNFSLGILYLLLEIIFLVSFGNSGGIYTTSTYLLFFVPFTIFLFSSISDDIVFIIVSVVGLSLAYSVSEDFYYSLSGASGVDYLIQRRESLRVGFDALGRIGDFFQAAGFTADHHDSANILGMVTCYTLNDFLYKKRIKSLVVSLISLIALFTTLSAANISLTLAVLFISIIVSTILQKKLTALFIAILGITVFAIVIFQLSGLTSIFLAKFSPDSDKMALFGYLNHFTVIEALPSFIWGHSSGFAYKITRSEISFVKLLVEYGIFHFFIIFSLLVYPLYFVISRKLLHYKASNFFAILFGVLTLFHYGSLLRITSIILFFLIYGNIYKKET